MTDAAEQRYAVIAQLRSNPAVKRIEVIGGQTLILGDCLEVMPTLGRFDAVVTDPPYGIGFASQPTKWQRRAGMAPKAWDNTLNDAVIGLISIAEVCMIWGGNYYQLPPTRGWLSWFKPDAPPSMASLELCWTSRNANARQISRSISSTNAERAGHPTQKPVAVMEWCLGFLPGAMSIIDPFMGSGTTLVACQHLGRMGTGIEIDPDYFDIACRRVEEAARQPDLFIQQSTPAATQEAMDL